MAQKSRHPKTHHRLLAHCLSNKKNATIKADTLYLQILSNADPRYFDFTKPWPSELRFYPKSRPSELRLYPKRRPWELRIYQKPTLGTSILPKKPTLGTSILPKKLTLGTSILPKKPTLGTSNLPKAFSGFQNFVLFPRGLRCWNVFAYNDRCIVYIYIYIFFLS